MPHLKGLKQEQMEQILDRFDAREEVTEGHVVLNQGDFVSLGVNTSLGSHLCCLEC